MMYLWLVIVLLAVLLWAWRSTKRPAWSPKGPPLMPWVGNLFSMDLKHAHHTYAEWAKMYGAIYHVKIGVMHQVVISDPDLIREAFSRLELSGRPDTQLFQFIVKGTGLVSSQGELWQESRRLTLHHLRNLGMGKSELEEYMHYQITSYMDEILAPNCGSELAFDSSLNIAVVNIIWKLVASEELSLTDTKVLNAITTLSQVLETAQRMEILDAAPWLSNVLPSFVFNKAKIEKQFESVVDDVFMPSIKKHLEDLDTLSEPRDYMEAMLREQQERPDLLTDWHLLMSVMDLFFAGNDTTATTLRWAFCFLCSRPEVQRRLQAELDGQVGRQRLPSLSDRSRLPYVEAVLLETQRLADITPLLVMHQSLAPVDVGRHRLPAGVQVIANVHSVHHSERLFPEPLQFRPERFLDGDGKFQPDKNVMPFSVGKRQCVGESMARAELFLFVTCFMQKFTFRWPEGFTHDLGEDPKGTFLRNPKPYKLVPERR
ncbi:cytochrome P450 2J6-like [Pollicipes pollicipes]|uniref:cytochrome P450 2J6-like n=1 Tax=Pollicipes pollicipes TaxID=41117 RepID=UPI001884906A|nr:cytochrome P450 2J6-like [Pollicipes pollicipes]